MIVLYSPAWTGTPGPAASVSSVVGLPVCAGMLGYKMCYSAKKKVKSALRDQKIRQKNQVRI